MEILLDTHAFLWYMAGDSRLSDNAKAYIVQSKVEDIPVRSIDMNKPLNVTLSQEIAQRINSKAIDCFDNAYKAALLTEGSIYVQGFLVYADEPCIIVEYGWIEFDERIVDPTFPHLNKNAQALYYFPAQRLTVKQLKAAVEEAKEDYPEDEPLPIYGASPYDYYGELMLGGAEYSAAYKEAEAKCEEVTFSR